MADNNADDSDVNSSSDSEVECDECECMINCTKEGVFILNKGANEVGANEVGANEVGANEVEANEVGTEEELVWCQSCFEELWQEAAADGWRGDDIEERLHEEEEEEEEKKRQEKER